MTMFRGSFFIALVAFTLCLPVGVQAECYLQGGSCHQALHCVEFHADEYGAKVVHKAGSGAANIVAALTLTDVVDAVEDSVDLEDAPYGSVVTGTIGGLEGVGKGVYRLAAGLFELGTAPLPFLGPVRYPRKNYFDEYREPVGYGTVSPYASMNVVPD